jgi:ATP-binding cassette, subfamily B, bacterial
VSKLSGVSASRRSSNSGSAESPASAAADPRDALWQLFSSPNLSNWDLFRWMFRFLRPVYAYAFWACLWLSLMVATEVLTADATGQAANVIPFLHPAAGGIVGLRRWLASADPAVVQLRHVILMLSLLIVAMVILRYLREVSNVKMSMNMVFYIRQAVYDKLQRVGFGFHDAISTGQLINRALSDLQNVRAFVQTAILTTLEILLVVIGYILMLITINPWVAALSVVPLPLWTYYILRFSAKIQPVSKSVMEARDQNVSILAENIAGAHVVKAFAIEGQEIAKYGRNCDEFLRRTLRRIRMFADFQPVIRSIAMASHLSLFLVGGILMLRGKLRAGDLMILGMAMGAILARLQQVANINEQYQNAIVSSRRLYEVLMARPTIPQRPHAQPLPPGGGGAVTFERVTFGYNPAKPVLHDISFTIPAGRIVALVGPTGAGKSTLVNLIARFYDPQQGRILIDGVDLRDLTLDSLRQQVAFVFQETYLFSDTVAANIAYGRPQVLEAEDLARGLPGRGQIEAAARLAQAHEFIEQLPKGYDTVLAERGSSLSGGQRQRLAIARAILSDPRVLVLDDATAAIDPETEDLIRRGLRLTLFGRTTFVIAHRISTVKQADCVLVVENGRITQVGTHAELMQRDGHYREIAAVQLYGDDEAIAARILDKV